MNTTALPVLILVAALPGCNPPPERTAPENIEINAELSSENLQAAADAAARDAAARSGGNAAVQDNSAAN